jgi:hypothetical protein
MVADGGSDEVFHDLSAPHGVQKWSRLWQCCSDHLIFLCYRLRADCQCWQTVFQHVLLRVVNLSGNTPSIQNEELPDFYAFY